MDYDRGMKIYFVRHGETNYNELGLCNSDPRVDVHVIAEGLKQAQALADKLRAIPIDHIFISELKRTRQTAEIMNTFHGLRLEVDSRLNDIHSGFEGKPFTTYMEALDVVANRWTARFNGGESIEDMKQRVAAFLNDHKAKPHHVILIVTSEWIIRAARVLIEHISNEEAWATDMEQGSYLELET